MKNCLPALIGAVVGLDVAATAQTIDLDASINRRLVLDNSGLVTEWQDSSGYGNSATPSMGAVLPEASPTSPSGLAGLDFGSSNNAMQLLDAGQSDAYFDFSEGDSGKAGFAVLLVARAEAINGDWNDVVGTTSAAASGFGMRFSSSGVLAAYLNGEVIQKPAGLPVTSGTAFVMAANYNAATGLFEFYDSINDEVTSVTVPAAEFGSGGALSIGSTDNASRFLDGAVYEVIAYERPLSPAQFVAEREILKAKWLEASPTTASPYVHLDALDSSISYASGDDVTSWGDLSGNGFDATAVGDMVTHSPAVKPSGSGIGGLDFGAASNRLELLSVTEQDAILDFTGDASGNSGFAVLVAFKADGFSPLWNDILGSDSAFSAGFALRMSNSGQPVATLEGADARASRRIAPGETVVYAFNYDALEAAYGFWDSVNGRTLVESMAPGDFSNGSPFTIGRSNNPTRYFNGSIYELKIFNTKLGNEQLEAEKASMLQRWRGLELPAEVLGVEGRVVERSLYLSEEDLAASDRLWLQVNNLSYENKGSIRLNDGSWLGLNHESVDLHYQEARRGGMAHGGYSTVRLSIPLATDDLQPGWNRIRFRFNESDGLSIGFRVVGVNLLDSSGMMLLPASRFFEEDPANWEGPYTDAASVTEGKALWETASLWSHYKAAGQTGWWYGHTIPAAATIKASCMDCHTRDGRDLEIFSYSNESIIQRSVFHRLSEDEGAKIASYIRSLSSGIDEVGRYGRPWNPPYQPGPEIAGRPVEQWAAGAGLDAVLEKDADLRDHLFPNGEINEGTVDDFFDSTKMLDHSLIPVALQFPDWKHWLPMIHPMDAWDRNAYYDNPTSFNSGISADVKNSLTEFHGHIDSMKQGGVNFSTLNNEYGEFRNDFRFFVASGDLIDNDGVTTSGAKHWRTLWGDANKDGLDIGSDLIYDAEIHAPIRQFATTSLARLLAVKNFEFHSELNIQGRADEYIAAGDQPGDRQWISSDYNVFEVPAHFNTPLNAGRHFDGQLEETGEFESTSWYQLQLVLNSGNGQMLHNSPVDYNYTPPFVLDASDSSGLFEPLRYFTVLNAAYQTKTWSGGMNPNDGKGFRIRVMGPWYIANISDSTGLNGFPPGYILTQLEMVEPGMSYWVMNAVLEQFLTEVEKPHNALNLWTRYDVGGNWSQNLDPISTSVYEDPLDPSNNLEAIGDWAHRIFYMVRFLSDQGADPARIDRLIDWGKAAWPNLADGSVGWDDLRGQSKTWAALSPNKTGTSELDSIALMLHNGGPAPVIEWYVNDLRLDVPTSTTELAFDSITPGDTIRAVVTGNASGIDAGNSVAEVSYTLPETGFKLSSDVAEVPTSGRFLVDAGETLNLQVAPIADPLIWLDAHHVTDGVEPGDGDAVGLWQDLSGNGYHAVAPAPVADYSPRYTSHAIDGRPGIEFGFNDADGLELLDSSEDDILNEDFSMFIIGTADIDSEDAPFEMDLIGNDTNFADDGEGLLMKLRNNTRFLPQTGGEFVSAPGYDHRRFLISIVKSGSKVDITYSGKAVATFELEASATLTKNNHRSTFIGVTNYLNLSTPNYFKGSVGEYLFYDRPLSRSEFDVVEGYLSHKWFEGSTLTSGNRYFAYSPVNVTISDPQGGIATLGNADYSGFEFSLDGDASFGNYQISLGGSSHPIYDLQLLRRQSFESWTASNAPLVTDRTGDFDLDGFPNYLEYVSGSSPTDASDFPINKLFGASTLVKFEVPMRVDDDSIVYQVQVSTDLIDWQDVDLPYTTSYEGGSTETITFDYPGSDSALFFRLMFPQ